MRRADMLRAKEGASCYICGGTYNLAIDHDHATGALLGILCAFCNTALGSMRDDITLLEKAIKYLKDPPGMT